MPVGLLGEFTTITRACAATAARISAGMSNAKSSVSGTPTWRPPNTSVSSRYSVKVGTGLTTVAPSPTVTASVAWISSLEPLPTSTPSALQSWRAARRASSSVGEKGG